MSTQVTSLSGHSLDATPAINGQILLPNTRYALSGDVTTVRLPSSDTLQIGDWVEIIPVLMRDFEAFVQIIDNSRLFSFHTHIVSDKYNPLRIHGQVHNFGDSSNTLAGTVLHRYRFNGRDWQPDALWSSAMSSQSELDGVQTFYSSGKFTVPAGVREITVDAVAAGGGGGGGGTAQHDPGPIREYFNLAGGGSGGGGGAAVIGAKINVTSGQEINIVIGSHGKAGTYQRARPANNIDGTDGTSGGNTQVGDWITLEGGKNGKKGTHLQTRVQGVEIPAVSGGAGGRVLKNNTQGGQQFSGGAGGSSGIAKFNASTDGHFGESIGQHTGGQTPQNRNSIADSGGGGGGASAFGDGGSERVSGANYGGGGGGSSGAVYTWSSAHGFYEVGAGGRGMVKISWEVVQ